MTSSRRDFIKKGASLTALSSFSLSKASAHTHSYAKDTNIELCLAYFYGLQERKIQLSKQMGILGAVSPSNPGMAGLHEIKPWEYEALASVKGVFEKRGLNWKVLEGTPPLDKAKLGIDGRDEQIENFITL